MNYVAGNFNKCVAVQSMSYIVATAVDTKLWGHKGKPIHMYPCIKEWMSLLTGLEQEGSS